MVLGSKNFLCALLMFFLMAGMPGTVLAGDEAEAEDDGFYRPPYLEQIKSYLEKNDPEKEDDDKEKEEEMETIIHQVRSGETVSRIASRYRVSVEDIASNNQLSNPHLISEGEVLEITRGAVKKHHVSKGDTIWDIAEKYGVSWRTILEVNEVASPNSMSIGTELVIPMEDKDSETMVAAASGAAPVEEIDESKQQAASNGRFIWPVEGWISSPYGPRRGGFHYGLDIAVSTGTPIRAMASGWVNFAGWRGGYGRTIIIDHGDGWETLYGHASRLNVAEGEEVYQGQIIARVGETGNATGPHLHLEIIKDGSKLNPKTQLPPR